MSILIVKNYEV